MKKMCLSALFLALNIILVRLLSLNAWNMKLNLGFIAIAAAAYFCGKGYAIAVAALGDLLGALLFPVGVYHPCFTVTAALVGLVYGSTVREGVEEHGIWALGTIAIINQLFIGLILNTALIAWVYHVDLRALMPMRILQAFIQGYVELFVLLAAIPIFERIKHAAHL